MSSYILVLAIYLACFCWTALMQNKRNLVIAALIGMAVSVWLLVKVIVSAGGPDGQMTLFMGAIAASLGFLSGFLARATIMVLARRGTAAPATVIAAVFLVGMPVLAYGYVQLRFGL